MAAHTLIIVTARNEAKRIEATLRALDQAFPDASVWVADDCSSDETPRIARACGARVVRAGRPLGKGGAATLAARDLLRWLDHPVAGQSGGEAVVVLCDGDLGDSAGLLGPLAEHVRAGSADLAVAAFARRAGGGFGLALGFARWAIHRRCGLRLSAPISGQRALRTGALSHLLPFAQEFGMEIGMTIDAARAGLRVAEVELDIGHRATGRTPSGFLHRGRQLLAFARVYRSRR
jgi:glycosyltransferase involved in cell wall biosynthesis